MELWQVPCSSEMCLPYCQWMLAKNKHCLLTTKTFSTIRRGRGFELFKKKQIPIHILKFYNGNVSKSPQTMHLVTPSFEPKIFQLESAVGHVNNRVHDTQDDEQDHLGRKGSWTTPSDRLPVPRLVGTRTAIYPRSSSNWTIAQVDEFHLQTMIKCYPLVI